MFHWRIGSKSDAHYKRNWFFDKSSEVNNNLGVSPLLISRGSGYPALSPLRYRYVTFKQHLLSLTQGTNNREAEKQTITGFVKEPRN